MRNARLSLIALCACLTGPTLAQNAPPPPTPEQLELMRAEDQLGLETCGVPRNASDDYRPAPLLPDQTKAPRITTQTPFDVEVVATGLAHAWGLAFLPDGDMLVTIRGEGLRTVSPDGEVSDLIAGTPAIKTPIRLFGMHDVILDRDFATNRRIYLAYITQVEDGRPNTGYIASARLSEDKSEVTDYMILKEGAFTPRRIVQAEDGSLLAVTADIITPYVAAQSMSSAQGKIIRLNTDGSVPADNPFISNLVADKSIYALGFRDTQGMAFHPETGELWIIENHPRGGDELNRVRAGENHGFPLISYGRDNNGEVLGEGKTQEQGLEQPVYFWNPSIAFSGLAFYTGDAIPEWKGDAFMGGLSGLQLVRVKMENGRVVGEEKLLRDRCERMRDVRMGPDGHLYVVTDAEQGNILRIVARQ